MSQGNPVRSSFPTLTPRPLCGESLALEADPHDGYKNFGRGRSPNDGVLCLDTATLHRPQTKPMRPDSSAVSQVTLPRTHYTEAHYGIRVILLGFGSVAVSIHLSVVTVAIVCHCQVIVRGGESGGCPHHALSRPHGPIPTGCC